MPNTWNLVHILSTAFSLKKSKKYKYILPLKFFTDTNIFNKSTVMFMKAVWRIPKLTFNVPIPDKVKKLSEIFIFTLLCDASKGFM